MDSPLLITMGDPAGIGPEVAVKAAAARPTEAPIVVVGDFEIMRRAAVWTGAEVEIRAIDDLARLSSRPGTVEVLEVTRLELDFPVGRVDSRAGAAAYEY